MYEEMDAITQKALERIIKGNVGNSSKTMYAAFMGIHYFDVNHPRDPSDFGRCYGLLQAVPEWKERLGELKKLSQTWSNLVDNRDKLTQMYEQNLKEEWKNHKQIGMYDFMQTLIVNKKPNEIHIKL